MRPCMAGPWTGSRDDATKSFKPTYTNPHAYNPNPAAASAPIRHSLPREESIAHEGVFYKYGFNVGVTEKLVSLELFPGISRDPFSQKEEYYLGVGLVSCLDGNGLEKRGGRNPINCVVCVDNSYSTGIPFGSETRLQALSKATVGSLLPQLIDNDLLTVLSYTHSPTILQPFQTLSEINLPKLKQQILDLKPIGGTSLISLLKKSSDMFQSLPENDRTNILFILTDSVPGNTAQLKNIIDINSKNKILTCFIGAGSNFDETVLRTVSEKSSVSWFKLDTLSDIKQTLDKEFSYMATQLFSHLKMDILSDDFEVERVYGSSGYEYPSKGVLLEMGPCCPSLIDEENDVKGGVILVKLKKISNRNEELKLPFEYIQNGKVIKDCKTVKFPTYSGEEIHTGPTRKAILLTRFVNLLKYFIRDERLASRNRLPLKPSIDLSSGIKIPTLLTTEQKQIDSDMSICYEKISGHYQNLITKFIEYYQKEVEIIQDKKLLDELKILQSLVGILPPALPAYLSQPQSINSLIDPRHTPDYLEKIKMKIKINQQKYTIKQQLSNQVELCFVMDCTGSMGTYISMCQRKINQIVDIITRDNPRMVIRIAFVGYRDHKDSPVQILPFCTDVNKIKNHITSHAQAAGGDDAPEDVCGGLEKALNLKWDNSSKKLLVFIADAPCHGNMYHSGHDNYPKGDPNNLIPEVLLTQLANKNINIFFARIAGDTDMMTTLWKNHLREYNPDFPLTIFPIQSDDDFVANITDAIASVIYSD